MANAFILPVLHANLLAQISKEGKIIVSAKNRVVRELAKRRLVIVVPASKPGQVAVVSAIHGTGNAALVALAEISNRIDKASGSPSWTAEEHDLLINLLAR